MVTPHANLLNEVVVYASDPRLIVEKAISKIPQNYSDKRDMLTGFYGKLCRKDGAISVYRKLCLMFQRLHIPIGISIMIKYA